MFLGMTMPRKKSRAATVDGQEYRFIVRPSDDHGRVGITIESQDYPSRPLYAEVLASDSSSRGIGAPQVAALVRAGVGAGWQPATSKGMFRLDDLLAAWAIEDDARSKIVVYGVDALLTDYLKRGAYDKVNEALGRIDPARYETPSILAILRVTAGAVGQLPNRADFVARAGEVVRERLGDRAQTLLASRNAL